MDSLLVRNVSAIVTIEPIEISFKVASIACISLDTSIIVLAINSEIILKLFSTDCISLDTSMIFRLMVSALFIIISIEIVFK